MCIRDRVRDRHDYIVSMILFVPSLTSVHSTVLQPPKEGTTMVPDFLVCSVNHQKTRMPVLCCLLEFDWEAGHSTSRGWSHQALYCKFRLLDMTPCMSTLTQNRALLFHFQIRLQWLVCLLYLESVAGCCFPFFCASQSQWTISSISDQSFSKYKYSSSICKTETVHRIIRIL